MSSPSRPKMPKMSACVVAPLMWPSAPQLYSVMPIERAGVVRVDPVLQPRDQLHAVVDPGLVDVVGIPQRARRSVAPQLHRGRHVVAELAALRIVVHGEDVEQALAGGRAALAQLVEQPGQVVRAAVIVAIGQRAPAVRAARTAGRSRCRNSRSSPTLPARRPAPTGSTALILRRVVDHLVPDLVHASRPSGARRDGSSARCSARCRGCSSAGRRVAFVPQRPTRCCTQPCWNVEFDGDVGVVRIVAGDVLAVGRARRCPRRGTTASRCPVCAPYLAIEKLASLLRPEPTLRHPVDQSGSSASPWRSPPARSR